VQLNRVFGAAGWTKHGSVNSKSGIVNSKRS
jgi:hypothetical protein